VINVLSKNLLNALNAQIGHELHNSEQYRAIAAYFRDQALFNFEKAFLGEAQGEREHAQKFIDFITDFRGNVVIPDVNPPINTFSSALSAVTSALALELKTTEEIYNLFEIAQGEKNHIAYNFLLWFVNEQQEEITTANDRISIVNRNINNLQLADLSLGD